MDGIENAVTPPAATPAPSAPSPAPAGTTDRGGNVATPAAPSGGATSAPTPEIQNLVSGGDKTVPGQTSGDDAVASLFPSEEELQTAPTKWRDRFGNIKSGYDKLEGDHKELKGWADNWKGLEEFGDPAAIRSSLEILNGFRGYKTDEQGNIHYDPETGLPQYNVRPGIEALAKESPAMPERLFLDLLTYKGQSGQTFAVELLQGLGLDPNRLPEYRDFTAGNVANTTGAVPPSVPQDRIEAFKSLEPDLQADFPEMTESAQKALLSRAQRDLEDRQWKEGIEAERQEQKQLARTHFQNEVKQAQAAYVSELRTQTLDSIMDSLVNQVTFSADQAANTVQTGVIKGTLAAILDPDLRAYVGPTLESLGVSIQGLDAALGAVVQNAHAYKVYEAYSKNPNFQQHRDDHAMGQTKANSDAALLRAKAKLSNVALKVAQALGGQVQAAAAKVDQQLANAQSRPAVTGSVGGGGPTPVKRGAPFSAERWGQ